MQVAVVHNAVDESDGPDAKDVLAQVETVCEALGGLGHHIDTIACTLDLDRFQRTLTQLFPDVVFNLVESLAGKGRLIHLAPFVMDAMGVPYTGSGIGHPHGVHHKWGQMNETSLSSEGFDQVENDIRK